MAAAELAMRIVLAVVFGVAFVSKVRSPTAFAAFASSLADIGWLRRGRGGVALAVAACEAVTVALIAAPWTVPAGFAAGIALLTGFTIVTGRELASGRQVRCRCFGAGTARIGPAQLARNIVLVICAAAGLAMSSATLGDATGSGLVFSVGFALLAALAIVRWDDLVTLARIP